MFSFWSRLAVSHRIVSGFVILLLLFAGGVGLGMLALERVSQAGRQEVAVYQAAGRVLEANVLARDFRLFEDRTMADKFKQAMDGARQALGPLAGQQGMDRIAAGLDQLGGTFGQIVNNDAARQELRSTVTALSDRFNQQLNKNFVEPISQRQNMASIMGQELSPNLIELLNASNLLGWSSCGPGWMRTSICSA